MTDADIGAVIADHQQSGALVTMAVIRNVEPDKYGGVVVDAGGVVTGFVRRGSPQPSYHFIGVQVAEAEAFAALPDNTPHESVGALYPALMAARREAVRAFVCDAEFMDIGTPADYLRTSRLLSHRDAVERDVEPPRWEHGARSADSPVGACRGLDPVGRCAGGRRGAAARVRRDRRRARPGRHLLDRGHDPARRGRTRAAASAASAISRVASL